MAFSDAFSEHFRHEEKKARRQLPKFKRLLPMHCQPDADGEGVHLGYLRVPYLARLFTSLHEKGKRN